MRSNDAANIAGALGFNQNRVVGFPRPIETRSLPTLTRSYPCRYPLIARTAHVLTPAT